MEDKAFCIPSIYTIVFLPLSHHPYVLGSGIIAIWSMEMMRRYALKKGSD
jgi:hypothetical protein